MPAIANVNSLHITMKLQVTNKQSHKTRLGKPFVRYFISALSRTCHLFSKCDLSCHCRGCVSGPPDCSATCQVPSTRGAGFWYCDGFNKSVDQVNNTLIIFRGDFATFSHLFIYRTRRWATLIVVTTCAGTSRCRWWPASPGTGTRTWTAIFIDSHVPSGDGHWQRHLCWTET